MGPHVGLKSSPSRHAAGGASGAMTTPGIPDMEAPQVHLKHGIDDNGSTSSPPFHKQGRLELGDTGGPGVPGVPSGPGGPRVRVSECPRLAGSGRLDRWSGLKVVAAPPSDGPSGFNSHHARRRAGECRMQTAECRLQNAECGGGSTQSRHSSEWNDVRMCVGR